jgi:hypothetical protein
MQKVLRTQILEIMSLLRISSCGMLSRVALVIADVSEELSASIIRVERIGVLGTFIVHRFLPPR